MLTLTLVIAILLALGAVMGMAPGRASDQPPAVQTVTVTHTVASSYRGHSASFWARRFKYRTRQLQRAEVTAKRLRRSWTPTVIYALRLASAVTGVPYRDLAAVSRCESTWNPAATNGNQLGLFQLGWRPYGFSPFDPVANALSAAQTVVHDGSWRQWVCKP